MIEIEEEETTAKSDENAQEQPWSEEFTVAGIDLVATIKDLIHEVSIRRIEIRDKEGIFRWFVILIWDVNSRWNLLVGLAL